MTEDSLTLNKAGNIFNYNQKSAGLVKNILSHDQEHEWTNILAGGRHYVSGALLTLYRGWEKRITVI